jgi:3-dehydroquinate dehydratase-2
MRVLVLNGPNLNLLGKREPDVYGWESLADLEQKVVGWGAESGVEITTFQSNSESEIVERIQTFDGDGIVINPGAFSHTSRAIPDAIRSIEPPVVEVHISDIRGREPWRAHSTVSEACARTIYGRGVLGYRHAIRHLVNRAAMPFQTVRYGPHDDNVGDLRAGGDKLVVLVHGGLWRHEHQRDSTERLAVDLSTRGYTTWNVEYRRLGNGGGWPGSGHDVLTSLDMIPHLGIPIRHVTVVAHSAGAYLAMWAAARSAVAVDLHVAICPMLDIGATSDHGDVGATEAVALLERGAPAVVETGGISTAIVHGDGDQIVPVERSVAYAERFGIEHHRTGCDHFSPIDPGQPEWSWVLGRIESS